MSQQDKNNNSNPMWGGGFTKEVSEIMKFINQSISFDKRLYKYDIQGSKAHCTMLIEKQIISEKDGQKILEGLDIILKEIEDGKFEFKENLEDIHMNIEYRLHQIIGDAAGKLHTARSRNDQVATDFKLFVREHLDILDIALKNMQDSLLDKAEEHYDTLMPGFTHLQTAQPVTFGHHLLAYFEMIRRDRLRISSAKSIMNECPLGAAALAGTSFPIDRNLTANILGFKNPTSNSIDSVSDRDFVIEFLSICSIIAIHLSRFAEEIVIWSSAEFSFIKLSDSLTTGSSIMPQKRNPDAAELVRAKTGRIFGSLNTILVVMKGLPLTYSKDMQEDKEPLFDAVDNILISISAMASMIEDMKINKEIMRKSAERGFSTATDLADWIVYNLGIPFRESHKISAKIVKYAEDSNCKLNEVPILEMQKIESKITKEIYSVLSVENSVKSRISYGGTSSENVKQMIDKIRKQNN